MRHRIGVYREWTRPLAECYRSTGRLIALDASQPLDDVSDGMYRELRDRGVDVGEPEVTEEEQERESEDY